jgi:UDP-N-acetylglucosamine 2-epimerase (non-hydrolysing)
MSDRPLKVMLVFGTRPEAIKMAPVVLALRSDPAHFDVRVTVTAQHREMLDQVLDHFALEPDHDLNVMSPRQSLTRLTSAMLEGLERVLAADRPDILLVHGDATTTLAASLGAFYARVVLGHVEAGLRTYEKYSPWPEEMNRRLTGVLADVHFAPTAWARGNLIREGVPEKAIYRTGNTAIDALFLTVRDDYRFSDPVLARELNGDAPGAARRGAGPETPLGIGRRLILVECHRRENWGEPMIRIHRALRRLAQAHPEVSLLVSAHLNPEAGEVARRELAGLDNVVLFRPVAYPDWVNLLARCYLVLTDSGGLQEEAPSVGRPLVLTRENTERPEAIEAGTVRLVGTAEETILETLEELLADRSSYRRMSEASNPFGDGRASQRVAQALLHHFGRRPSRPEEFGTVEPAPVGML